MARRGKTCCVAQFEYSLTMAGVLRLFIVLMFELFEPRGFLIFQSKPGDHWRPLLALLEKRWTDLSSGCPEADYMGFS